MKIYQFEPSVAENDNLYISGVEFEEINECETYDRYGQVVGCYNAGCYTLDNSASDIEKDLIEAINQEFKTPYVAVYCDDLNDILDELEITDEKIRDFATKWLADNEEHTLCKAYNYWDGSNWKSIVKENIAETFLFEVEDKELEAELENADWSSYEYGVSTAETENFIFTSTQFASWFEIEVEKK